MLIKNQKSIKFIKSVTSTISGSLAGTLDLTNLHGFLFYIFTAFPTSSLIWFITHHSGNSLGYYKILGVDKLASNVEIRPAYLRLSRRMHPDKQGGAPTLFQQVWLNFLL
ncbi:hypothetical protein DFH28DRAFT_1186443 [Melampsora americana]|nr:hypothetical protein DFH28DRAFT_1186443 [Melampsora americana]